MEELEEGTLVKLAADTLKILQYSDLNQDFIAEYDKIGFAIIDEKKSSKFHGCVYSLRVSKIRLEMRFTRKALIPIMSTSVKKVYKIKLNGIFKNYNSN